MSKRIWMIIGAVVAALPAFGALADMQPVAGGPQAGVWAKREAVTPNPDKVMVPPGYKVGVFKAGLDTPSAAAVDKDGQCVGRHFRQCVRRSRSDRPAACRCVRQKRQADQGNRPRHLQDRDERDRLLRRQ